jgi:hypothetical protein
MPFAGSAGGGIEAGASDLNLAARDVRKRPAVGKAGGERLRRRWAVKLAGGTPI